MGWLLSPFPILRMLVLKNVGDDQNQKVVEDSHVNTSRLNPLYQFMSYASLEFNQSRHN